MKKMNGQHNINYKHGHKINGKVTGEYQSWQMMKMRCYNSKRRDYKWYGERGIIVCDRWVNSFENFLEDMGERPKECSLDRINSNGNYEPSNCRWADKFTQHRNQSNVVKITYNNTTKIKIDWAREFKVCISTITRWYNKCNSFDQLIDNLIEKKLYEKNC